MAVLSHGQFKQLTAQANELNPEWGNESGFSVKLQQGPQGEVQHATNANMVGGVVPTTSHGAPLEPRQLTQFGRHHLELLRQTEMYLGVWHEGNRKPEAGVDLDVAEAFPRTPEGRMDARVATVARGEKAYGEVEPDDYTTHTNPFRTPMVREGVDALSEGLRRLRSDPEAYASVVGGDVVGAMSSWVRR